MVAQQRFEYHWIENRVVQRIVYRPEWVSQWRFNIRRRTLVAVIEESDRSFTVHHGPETSPERIVDCVRLYENVLADESIPDFSGRMPESVREELRTKLNEAITSVQRQLRSFAEETDITGHLKGKLNGIIVERDRWRIAVKSWTYKRNPKEHIIGADMGVIFDVLYGGKRLIKAMWYQAKIDKEGSASLDNVQDLAEQVEKMKRYTDEAYTLLYTPDVIITTRGMDEQDYKPLSDNLVEGAICERGDRDPKVISNTADIKQVLEFYITGPQEQAK